MLLLMMACSGGGDDAATTKGPDKGAKAEPKDPNAPPEPTVDLLTGPARPALLLTQAWFWMDDKGMPNPGPARLDVWREGEEGWEKTRLEDPDSNVFHKAIAYGGGILTIGADGPYLKHWTIGDDGSWSDTVVWHHAEGWGGKYNRLRDIEIGDVDGDGVDELVIATHDGGVVAVAEWDPSVGGEATVVQMDAKPDTFVHEVEIGDVDGDGKNEFFVTPSDRNKANASQTGGVAMYSWDGTNYTRTWVEEPGHGTHAKEVTVADIDGDGVSEVFVVNEAEIDPEDKTKILTPVQVRQYTLADGAWSHTVIASIDDRQTRFLVPGDFDGDGKIELIAAAFKAGLFHLVQTEEGWTSTRFEQASSGFEHAIYGADLNGDGALELYVAADDQRELKKYTWNAERGSFDKQLLGRLDAQVLTWNITTGTL